MTIPDENTNTTDGLDAAVSPATPDADLDDNWRCDVDGARMEQDSKRTVGDTTYSVRLCSANPNHTKMIPV